MRRFLLLAPIVVALLISPVQAESARQVQTEQPVQQSRLDELFSELKTERNEAAARRIANRIRQEWQRSGGATADVLIEWAHNAAGEQKFHVALDLLDQAVTLYPNYVESWNNRALIYLMMNDFDRAMSDLSRVLAIEPRHFGAMSGLAGVLRVTGNDEGAREVYRRMLEIYPMQRSAQRALLDLTDQNTDEQL